MTIRRSEEDSGAPPSYSNSDALRTAVRVREEQKQEMKIGLTYDLRAEYIAMGWSELDAADFDSGATIDGIEAALQALGHTVHRIGRCVQLAERLVAGERWDIVFNICEGAHGRSREAQVPALCDAFDQPCTFCDALTAALTLDKALTKRVIRDAGINTPGFAVIANPEDLNRPLPAFPLFAKPVAEGTGKGIDATSVIRTPEALASVCAGILERYKQPVLVEEFLPGREVTVGLVGTDGDARVLGVMDVRLRENAEAEVYSYTNKELCEERIEYQLVEPGPFHDECARLALAAYQILGCRDAARIDLRANATGRPSFMEVNPIAGLHPQHSDLPILNALAGRNYVDLIGDIVASAARRVPCGQNACAY